MAGKPKESGKTKKPKSRAGAKEKYNDDFPLLAQGFARDGFNDKQICEKLGISTTVFYEYQKKYPEFAEALKRGKAPVDTEVENALLKRAMGFDFTETHTEAIVSNDGKVSGQKVKKVKKHYPPDVTACIFWLKNRKRKQYRENGDKGFEQDIELPSLEVQEIPYDEDLQPIIDGKEEI